MMTPEGGRRILDYRAFRHNFGKFSEFISELNKNHKRYRSLVQETQNHPSIRGHGIYFKHKRIKLDK